ncbi:MAG: alpha-2-macroglobulin family protein [Verrucomicrobia bacterium]|nr:MAG: alpha-2-macroglobulin family protein [Verrucomicrobiota bacterium]
MAVLFALRARFGRGAAPGAPVADALMAPAAAPPAEGQALVAESAAMGRPALKAAYAEPDGARRQATNGGTAEPEGAKKPIDWSRVAVRRNLRETAFFFPQLTTDADGRVRLTFTMPEALTEWRFLGFAHTRDLAAGLLEGSAVTALELMVQPNPPRFLREADVIEFTAKVTNQSDQPQQGRVVLHWWNALTDEPLDASLENARPEREFTVPPGESRVTAWRLRVPDGLTALRYRVVAASASHSDGEEGMVPVIARRVLVRESFPLAIRGPGERKLTFESLVRSGESASLAHRSLTLQVVSNPAWYAILALPYLMEYPHECTEQTFNRYYANALARYIANSDPRIRQVFDQWKNTPALDSPLAKNEDLKNVLLQETPWWDEAQDESQARRHVGLLFDDNRLNAELQRAFEKLVQAQYADGVWPWFPGGPRNDYITLYIVTGFGRLRHLGVPVDVQPALRALDSLDAWLKETHDRILEKEDPKANHLSPRIALQLYGRSFFLDDHPIAPANRPAYDYFLDQARRYWVQLGHRQSQGHLALALLRFGDRATARAIVRSLEERSVVDEELGRYWRDTERSWWWYRAPIETQALMIEVFDEVAQDPAAVEECQIWLLKQKQTRDWKTTKATADAIYALLLRGRNWLADRSLVEVRLGRLDVTPGRFHRPGRPAPEVEAGTGAYEVRFGPGEIRPDMGRVTLRKPTQGIAWGGLHWAYYEDVAKVRAYAETPLQMDLQLHRKRQTADGPVLEPVRGPVHVGDELVLRLVLRVDRDMEYVHLKLPRGSGTEPTEVLSGYRHQDGLAYYQSIRDTATHCFIDYLPKGTYVFEHSARVQLRGRYETGFATLQCMYAPEFSSHSASLTIQVE